MAPVIDQLKNFIRHGKTARDATPNNTTNHHQPSASPPYDSNHQSTNTHASTSRSADTRDMRATSAAAEVAHDGTVNTGLGYMPEPSGPTSAVDRSSPRASPVASKQTAASNLASGLRGDGLGAVSQDTADGRARSKNDAQMYNAEAQKIVDEERRASEKMPRYEGLSERFTLICKMGDGAFSNVYKARDHTTGQKVAIKVVRKYELNSSQQHDGRLDPQFRKKNRVTERANILKEVQIMRNLRHDGIVELLEFSESREHYFLVLELLEGGELFHQIVHLTYFSEALSRHVILQVANGIRYLHEVKGVVHRDIKPENLLFESIKIIPSKVNKARPYDEEKEDEGEFMPGIGGGGIGRVKIADFGLSKIVWEESTMTPCGTVGYTAPEIVKDERYSKSVDMWALGCVLYTLLCGFPPFYDESISVLTEKVAKGYYTFLSPWWDDISDSAKDLITHLLCVDVSKRYTIDEFLAHPWCNVQDARPALNSAEIQLAKTSEMPLDSPLLLAMKKGNNVPRNLMSPGINQLKEAFDVTYAVHRMEEEGASRANRGKTNEPMMDLNEADEDGDHDVSTLRKYGAEAARHHAERQRQAPSQTQQPSATAAQQYVGRGGADRKLAEAALYEGRAGTRDRGSSAASKKRAFELNMGAATLLGRRNKGGMQPFNLGGLEQTQSVPGSPMRVD